MINYDGSNTWSLLGWKGSLLPRSFLIALPCSLITAGLKWLAENGRADWVSRTNSVMPESAIWGGFSVLVAFLTIFRTSQSYSRFWEGCQNTHQMRAEWFDACSALIAFTRYSEEGTELISKFQHSLIRLVSMLHAVALAELEDALGSNVNQIEAFKYELLDVDMMDPSILSAVKRSNCKVELVYQWIQMLVVENMKNGVLSIPPPVLSRSFQELSNGMVAFNSAIKISWIPFPFPYAQMCEVVLLLHWLWTPIITCTWTNSWYWAFLISFLQVFILWALNGVAKQIENPFGMDENDIDGKYMQLELNEQLIMLIEENQRIGKEFSTAFMLRDLSPQDIQNRNRRRFLSKKSFHEIWNELQESGLINQERLSEMYHSEQARDTRHSGGDDCVSPAMTSRSSAGQSHAFSSPSDMEIMRSMRSLKRSEQPKSGMSWRLSSDRGDSYRSANSNTVHTNRFSAQDENGTFFIANESGEIPEGGACSVSFEVSEPRLRMSSLIEETTAEIAGSRENVEMEETPKIKDVRTVPVIPSRGS